MIHWLLVSTSGWSHLYSEVYTIPCLMFSSPAIYQKHYSWYYFLFTGPSFRWKIIHTSTPEVRLPCKIAVPFQLQTRKPLCGAEAVFPIMLTKHRKIFSLVVLYWYYSVYFLLVNFKGTSHLPTQLEDSIASSSFMDILYSCSPRCITGCLMTILSIWQAAHF